MSEPQMPSWDSLFIYSDGKLFWKFRPVEHFNGSARYQSRFNTMYMGKEAGNVNDNGYRLVYINKQHIGIHRIIFAMHYGYLPLMIDHIDGNPLNNKLENLRECTPVQNQYNRRISKASKSGVKGVCWDSSSNKWRVSIKVDNKLRHVGLYSNKNDAIAARKAAAEKYHGEFVNHG